MHGSLKNSIEQKTQACWIYFFNGCSRSFSELDTLVWFYQACSL